MFYKFALEIDLLPFGDIENENREIQLYDPTLFVINMPGFKEAYPFVTELELPSGQTLKICSLEGLVMLIAYGDNPSRTKDITDIDHILENYFDLFHNNVYDEHFDVMDMYHTEDREYLGLVGARVIGRKIKDMLDKDDQLIERMIKTLYKRPTNFWQALASGLKD